MRRDQQPRLLIVEDDLDLAEMLSAYFGMQGYAVASTGRGEEAVRLAGVRPPDLILLDIRLPDIDGLETSRRLRESHITRYVPIIFLTERRGRLERLQGLRVGVTDYITKPFDIHELRLRIHNTLERAALLREANPVTGLPEREQVFEALETMRAAVAGSPELLVARLLGLLAFREMYGFVASDDVLRMIGLTLSNATSETCGTEGFCGHLDDDIFVLLAPTTRIAPLRERVVERLRGTLDLFYPADDRGPHARTPDRLALTLSHAAGPPPAANWDEVRRWLLTLPNWVMVE